MKTSIFDMLNLHQPRTVLPERCDETDFLRFLRSVRVEGGPSDEFARYLEKEWRRFLFTWHLCRHAKGRALEIGAAPYFTTAILLEFTQLEVVMSNYALGHEKVGRDMVCWTPPRSSDEVVHVMSHDLFNVESDVLPYPDGHFDLVLFCEVLEHLTEDPMRALIEIRRVLKPTGRLVLTTPNAAALQNVFKMLMGKSVADRYSAYGPYGRHNREYTRKEVIDLLAAVGFSTDQSFTANVLFRRISHLVANFCGQLLFAIVAPKRARNLGQYTFVLAKKQDLQMLRRPDWLYRSYSDAAMTFRN
jgi:SAM-dependent methyltransferase